MFSQGTCFYKACNVSDELVPRWSFFSLALNSFPLRRRSLWTAQFTNKQCDQIWRNFATLANMFLVLDNFNNLVYCSAKFWTYFGKFCIIFWSNFRCCLTLKNKPTIWSHCERTKSSNFRRRRWLADFLWNKSNLPEYISSDIWNTSNISSAGLREGLEGLQKPTKFFYEKWSNSLPT